MRVEKGLHLTVTERKAIKHMRNNGLADAKIGKKEYHIRGEYVHIVEMKKPLGMIGEKPELIRTIHEMIPNKYKCHHCGKYFTINCGYAMENPSYALCSDCNIKLDIF